MSGRKRVSDAEIIARQGASGVAIAYGIAPLRRFLARLPLPVLLPVTLLLTILTLPFGLAVPFVVWLLRHQAAIDADFVTLFGEDSEQVRELRQSQGREGAYPIEREYDLVANPPKGSFNDPADRTHAPRFGRKTAD